MKSDQVAAVTRQAEIFGGMFGARGPKSLRATVDGKELSADYEHVVPATAVTR
jgi:hypothetical protein